MSKFPLVRIHQFVTNPRYIIFWLRRLMYLKKDSFEFEDQYVNYNPMSNPQTLEYIIKNNKSIIRFGDGEFGLLSGAGIFPPDSDWSQKYNLRLKLDIERQMSLVSSNILTAFPSKQHLFYREGKGPVLDVISSMHTEARMFLFKFLNQNQSYGSWSVFMPQHHKSMDWQLIKNYIESKTVVIVTGGTSMLQDIKLGRETLFIECGKHNSYARLDTIKNEISNMISQRELQAHSTIFWVSLGCNAGFLVEDLARNGFVAWDTGHIFRFAKKQIMNIR